MQYVNYEEDVVHKYDIELVGWTPDKWCNPSDLTSSLATLRPLLNAIKDGSCKFVTIPPADLKVRRAKYDADIAAGRIRGKHRNQRSDVGQKRKRAVNDVDEGTDNEGNNDNPDERGAVSRDEPPTAPATATGPDAPLVPSSIEEPAELTAKPRKRVKTGKATSKVSATAPAASKAKAKPKPRPKKGKENQTENSRALARLAAHRPGSAQGRVHKSRAIVTSDDEGPDVVAVPTITSSAGDVATANSNAMAAAA